MLRVTAPAKLNLHLSIGSRRADGYHDLEGVFHALELADEISIEPADELSLECDIDLGVALTDNLAYRAALAMGEAFGRRPAVRIHLLKRIPHGAGMGGGSSDAAAVVAGLATLWGESVEDERCHEVAASLGADVPFFLVPGGCALMVGRGDRVGRALPALAHTPVAVVRPPEPVPTAAAYAAFDADPRPTRSADSVVAALVSSDRASLAAALFNNMEAASSAVVPAVEDALAWIRAQRGVAGAAVAGSGSAVFAIVAEDGDAQRIARDAGDRGWWAAATQLADHGARVCDDARGSQ